MTFKRSKTQQRKHGLLSCLTALMLVSAPLIMTGAPAAQTPARVAKAVSTTRATKVRPTRTMAQRLEARLPQAGVENPFVPVLMHAFERYLAGAPSETFVDQAARDALKRHPKVTRQHLQTLVKNWKSLPAATRARVEPSELRNLNPSQKLNVSLLDKAVRRTVAVSSSGVADDNNAKVGSIATANPRIKNLFGTAHKKTSDGTPIITKGGGFMIDAENVPAEESKIKIHFIDTVGGSTKTVASVTPKNATKGSTGVTTMTAAAPASLSYGDYQLQVEVIGFTKSNKVWMENPAPNIKIDTKISGIDPPARYPGSKAEFQGLFAYKDVHLIMERLDEEGYDNFTLTFNDPKDGVDWISATQIDFTVPQSIPPGKYRVAVRKSTGGKRSNWVNFTVKAPQYQVKFTKAHCIDESDPEGGADELTTMWVIDIDLGYKDERMAFNEDYYSFDDNSQIFYKSAHQQVFPYDGEITRPVSRHMVILTAAMDWDSGDIEDAKEVLGAIGSASVAIGSAFGPIGAAVGAVVAGVLTIVGAIITIWGGADMIGAAAALSHSAPELQKLTAGKKELHRTLRLGWSDDSGKYDLHYTILRHQPN